MPRRGPTEPLEELRRLTNIRGNYTVKKIKPHPGSPTFQGTTTLRHRKKDNTNLEGGGRPNKACEADSSQAVRRKPGEFSTRWKIRKNLRRVRGGTHLLDARRWPVPLGCPRLRSIGSRVSARASINRWGRGKTSQVENDDFQFGVNSSSEENYLEGDTKGGGRGKFKLQAHRTAVVAAGQERSQKAHTILHGVPATKKAVGQKG